MLAKIQSVWNSQTLLGMQDGIATVVVSFFFFLHLFFGHSIWHVGAKFPDQGSNPCPPAVEVWSRPNHWTTRQVPVAVS